jgi:hypothetical protein
VNSKAISDATEVSVNLFLTSVDQEGCAVLLEPFGAEYEPTGEHRLRVVVGALPGGELEVVHGPGVHHSLAERRVGLPERDDRLEEQVPGLLQVPAHGA